MKEKDFEKCLDNIIIDGLIKEAEQDNADFEIAMREMTDEDFLALIYNGVSRHVAASINKNASEPVYKELIFEEGEIQLSHSPIRRTKGKILTECSPFVEDGFADNSIPKTETRARMWKPWIAAIASAAAILLIILLPGYYSMNSRLCESALIASSSFVTPSRGIEISSMTKDEIKELLPELIMQYEASMGQEESINRNEDSHDESSGYYFVAKDPMEAGLDLVQAYLKLNERGKAIEILTQLSHKYGDSEFGDQCKKLLDILD